MASKNDPFNKFCGNILAGFAMLAIAGFVLGVPVWGPFWLMGWLFRKATGKGLWEMAKEADARYR